MEEKKKGRLKLTRRVGETILIGTDVEVTIKAVSGQFVTVETSAPCGIRILRKEIQPYPQFADAR